MLLVLLSTVFLAVRAEAQFAACPFNEDVAEPDSLHPAGYIPLQIGNTWEHLVWSGCCLDHAVRREVVADTLIGDHTFFVVSESNSKFLEGEGDPLDSTTVDSRETARRYLSVQEEWLVEWSRPRGTVQLVKLGAEFQSCYSDPESGHLAVVWELPPATFDLKKTLHPDDSEPTSGKAVDINGEQSFYQYGVGYVSGSHADTAVVLTYAQIDGLSFGAPMDHLFVSSEGPPETPEPSSFELVAYPNPFSDRAQIELSVPHGGRTSVRVVDLLGRTVGQLLRDQTLMAGRHKLVWNPDGLGSGIYFIQVFHDGHLVETRSVILAR